MVLKCYLCNLTRQENGKRLDLFGDLRRSFSKLHIRTSVNHYFFFTANKEIEKKSFFVYNLASTSNSINSNLAVDSKIFF